MSGEDVRVSYGVKELLERLDRRLESIDGKLDAKADLRDVIDLRDRFSAFEREYQKRLAVEADKKESSESKFTRRHLVLATFVGALVVLIQPIEQHIHF